MSAPQPVINDPSIEVGEIPRWHSDEGVLYWADISRPRLFRYDPRSGTNECLLESNAVRGISVQENGALLLSGPNASLAEWQDGELTPLTDGLPGDSTFNDSCVDAEGRLYGSQMALHGENDEVLTPGRICRVDPDGSYHTVAEGIGAPNGITISGDDKALYVADNSCATVWAYAYDRAGGELGERREFVVLPEGTPDGMDVDADGNLWLTHCGGGCVVCYDLTGNELRRIDFPCGGITACTFGGLNLETLYVTSLGGIWRATPDDLAGCLFAIDVDVSGRPLYQSRIQP